ncbi:MAG TPA: hypothetical protein VD971_02810 [Phycisphaerales bacterium]|nr:hypothetical protein [Phycisphaerales bacterium]
MRFQPVVLSVLAASALAPRAFGSFVAPDGTNFPWTRGSTPNSAYALWEVFTSPAGPNAPDAGVYVGGSLPAAAPSWNAYDTSGQSFVTGGGNIYSITAPTSIRVIAPNFDLGDSQTTTVLLQVRTQGTEILPSSVHIGGVAPVETVELSRQPLGGFGGFTVDTLFRWELQGNAVSYEIRFDAAESSMSLDRVAVDTFTTPVGCDSIDFNGDGLFPDNTDLEDFLSVFGGGPCTTGMCGDTDFNNDGLFPDNVDIEALFSVFGGGNCLR